MSLPDRELWGAATMVARRYGDRAPVHIAEQIGRLALAGDAEGVATWREIARRLDQLMREGTAQ